MKQSKCPIRAGWESASPVGWDGLLVKEVLSMFSAHDFDVFQKFGCFLTLYVVFSQKVSDDGAVVFDVLCYSCISISNIRFWRVTLAHGTCLLAYTMMIAFFFVIYSLNFHHSRFHRSLQLHSSWMTARYWQ